MPWLLVGIQHSEIDFFGWDSYQNLDFKDADNIGNIFQVETWAKLLEKYGNNYFDVIMTDGGLMGVKRVDKIIIMKNMLLKEDGYILNYTSILGEKVDDPLGRPEIYFYKISKKDYTIQNHDKAWESKDSKTWSDQLKHRIKLII